jgi:type VI secretion system Hcp family effector
MITKRVDKASPVLMQAVAKGVHFNEVVIEFYRSGAFVQRYRLKDTIISTVQTSAAKAGNDRPSETVTLVAAEMTEEK